MPDWLHSYVATARDETFTLEPNCHNIFIKLLLRAVSMLHIFQTYTRIAGIYYEKIFANQIVLLSEEIFEYIHNR